MQEPTRAGRTPLRLAVLLSGSGTTLENLFERQTRSQLPAEVAVVIASRPDALGLERARRRNVPGVVVARRGFADTETFSAAVFEVLAPYRPDLVCLAGFMVLLRIPTAYAGRVLNVHPALLPGFGGAGFYGHRVHEAVLKAGCKITGCTVHFVNDDYDRGPIILQKAVPVLEDDTAESLAERVQAAEREIYPEAIRLYAEGRLKIVDGRVRIGLKN